MRWGIFSDIHANLEALQAVLTAFSKEHIDKYFCLGDIVGYGADPSACIVQIKKLNPVTIAGNHDWAAVNLFDTLYFNPHARAAVLWTAAVITEQDKQFLKALGLIYQEEELTLVHGSLHNPGQFEYILDIPSARETFKLLKTELCFVGHTHRAEIFIKKGEEYTVSLQAKIKLEAGRSYIINTGSVGQPRDGNPQASFVVYDSQKQELQIKRTPYDIDRAQQKIHQAGLPALLAERLATGS